MNLQNKVGIVTGASSGIGLATARLLGQNGVRLALVSRSKQKLQTISNDIPHSFVIPADMSKPKEIISMVKQTEEHFGRVDILVNDAGRGYDASIEKTDIAILQDIFDLDVVGPLIAMQQVIPLMRRQGGGAIVNISSGTARMHLPNMGGYAALKAALAAISLTAHDELDRDHITVSVVYPYITLTEFEEHTIKGPVIETKGYEGGSPQPPDTAEYIAGKILEAIQTGKPEVFAHDWMAGR
jgi:short-subunit dehydrogenase